MLLLNDRLVPTLELTLPNLAGTSTITITFSGASSNTVTSGFTVNATGTQITGIVVPAAHLRDRAAEKRPATIPENSRG